MAGQKPENGSGDPRLDVILARGRDRAGPRSRSRSGAIPSLPVGSESVEGGSGSPR